MSDTPELPNDDAMTIKYGLGWRSTATGELEDIVDEGSLPEGNPVFACELPPVIAYEIGWALSMYGKTLHEFAEGGTSDPESKDAAERKRDISLSLATAFRDAAIRGVKLQTGEELLAYDTSKDFTEDEAETDGGEA